MTIQILKNGNKAIALFRESKHGRVNAAQLLTKKPKPIDLDTAQEIMEQKNLQHFKYVEVCQNQ